MFRKSWLVVLSLSLALPCSPVIAQAKAKAKKKDQPRVLKEGDEFKIGSDPAVVLRDPNLEKAGILESRSIVFPACLQSFPDRKFAEYQVDSRDAYIMAGRFGDRAGIERMLAEGRALRLPAGTTLLVLQRNSVECRCRVTSGEHTGKVVIAFIKYLN
jgi:hypothetical protein